MSDSSRSPSRRRFLIATTAVAAVGGSIGRLTGCASGPPPGPNDVGAVSDFALDTFRVPTVLPTVIVARDAGGIYAFSSVCTHMGCTVPLPVANRSRCPCHQSEFDGNGDLIRPATGATTQLPLGHFVVTFTGTGGTARVVVDTSMPQPDRAARAQPLA